MALDENGIIECSIQGCCVNYKPDMTRPTRVRAHNVEGKIIYECLNFEKKDFRQGDYCANCSNHLDLRLD
jgi:hypothetical protein